MRDLSVDDDEKRISPIVTKERERERVSVIVILLSRSEEVDCKLINGRKAFF